MSDNSIDVDKLLHEALSNKNASVKPLSSCAEPKPSPSELPLDSIQYFPLAFENAVDFLYFFDKALSSGKKSLHPWQKETLLFLSDRYKHNFTTDTPLNFDLLACNGSGKDAYVIAGFATFVLCCWKRYKVVITSSSDQQLDTQTRAYIADLCSEVNAFLQSSWGIPGIIDCKKETFESRQFDDSSGRKITITGSKILTFVTNQGGKAEGHHPYPDADTKEGVILIANEAKTIPGEIWQHFQKCTYNIFLKVSSAGEAKEYFYKSFTRARDWNNGYIPGKPFKRKVTWRDCPHLTRERIEQEIEDHKEDGGADSDWFQQSRESNFVSSDGSVVITSHIFQRNKLQSIGRFIDIGLKPKAGLDIGGGGDPSALWIFNNNKCIGAHSWSFKDTQLTVDLLCGTKDNTGLFKQYNLHPEDIIGDGNGIGQGVIDAIRRRLINPDGPADGPTWDIKSVCAQFAAINKIRYSNRGAEWWFRVKKLMENGIIDFGEFCTTDVEEQFTKRHYTTCGAGKLKLWGKEEEKAEGYPSPNDADAIVLAFSDVDIYDFIERGKVVSAPKEKQIQPELLGTNKLISLAQQQSHYAWTMFEETRKNTVAQKQTGLMSAIGNLYGN